MNDEFKPRYLYVKTHNQTGLKYFGKTCQEDPDEYEGSGVRWSRHIKKHGYDVTTEIIGYYTEKEKCNSTALFLSDYWDVVASNDWANLIPEDGLGGGGVKGRKVSAATRQKLREKALVRVATEGWVSPLATRPDGTSVTGDLTAAGLNPFSKQADGTSVGRDTNQERVAAGTHNFLKRSDGSSVMSDRTAAGLNPSVSRVEAGIHHWQHKIKDKECPHCHKWFTDGHYANHHGDRCKQNPARIPPKPRKLPEKKECPHCHRWVTSGNYDHWHGDMCKQKPTETQIQEW